MTAPNRSELEAEQAQVTWQQACDAIESLDDYARMMVGVDPTGPRELLYRFVEQQKRKAAQRAEPQTATLVALTRAEVDACWDSPTASGFAKSRYDIAALLNEAFAAKLLKALSGVQQ